jgi:hypothetical protein
MLGMVLYVLAVLIWWRATQWECGVPPGVGRACGALQHAPHENVGFQPDRLSSPHLRAPARYVARPISGKPVEAALAWRPS